MLVKWGSIIVKGTGKLGGHVFSTGRSGASVHTRAKARNPQTKYQMQIRSRFTQFTQGWRDLTDTQRESWYDAESSFSRTNRFGDVVTLSGKNLYESLNTQRAVIVLPPLSIAPMPILLEPNVVTEVRFRLSEFKLFINGIFGDEKVYVIVGTKPLSQGTKFVQSNLRILGFGLSIPAGDNIGTYFDTYDMYVARFGVPTVGQNIFIGTYFINESGQRTPVSIQSAIYD